MKTPIETLIEHAKLEYQSDISWQYTAESQSTSITFSKDADGNNSIDEFCVKHKGLWVEILPTDAQIKLMYDKLNNTPYREDETFSDAILDTYSEYGVNRKDFY